MQSIDILAIVLENVLDCGNLLVELGLDLDRNLVAVFAEGLLGLEDHALGIVPQRDRLTAPAVFIGVLFGFLNHALDFVVRKTGGTGDGDLLLLAGRLILGGHVQDAVGVDVEGHFDLRHTARRRQNAVEDELAEALVVGRHRALALKDVDLHLRLAVGGGGEDLALAGRDRRVALDQRGGDATQRFDREGQRGDVEEQDVLDVATEHAALDRRTDRDHFVRVDALVRFLAEEALDLALDGRHAGLTTDEDSLVDLALAQAGVLERGLHRAAGALDQTD